MGFPSGASGKESAFMVKNLLHANEGDIIDKGSIPGLGSSPGGGHGNPLQYSCLENPMDRGAQWVNVYRVGKSQTWLKWLSMHTYVYTHTYTLHETSVAHRSLEIYSWIHADSMLGTFKIDDKGINKCSSMKIETVGRERYIYEFLELVWQIEYESKG